jgi:hypothetical protein
MCVCVIGSPAPPEGWRSRAHPHDLTSRAKALACRNRGRDSKRSAAFSFSSTEPLMTTIENRPIAIFYEHPDWFRPLFAELDRRGIEYVKIDANAHTYDPADTRIPYSLVFNRASPSAYLRSEAESTYFTLDWLRYLERRGVEVVNGSAPYSMEISKALQLDILQELGLPYPRARVINSGSVAAVAARGLRVPGRRQSERRRKRRRHHAVRLASRARARVKKWLCSTGSRSHRARAGIRPLRRWPHHSSRDTRREVFVRNKRLPGRRLIQSLPRRRMPDH